MSIDFRIINAVTNISSLEILGSQPFWQCFQVTGKPSICSDLYYSQGLLSKR